MSSGIGIVLNIAKDALAAQQYGIYVSGHNIANANTAGYSKQSPVLEARRPVPYAGVLVGRGVDTTKILRTSDQLVENRLIEQKSSLSSFEEMDSYMLVLEGLFNESSGNSLSNMIGEFWNMWHDIADNPSGAPERIALCEHSVMLSEQFNALDSDLFQLDSDLTSAIEAGIERINEITAEIASLNNDIAQLEISSPANDLRDKRNVLASELAEYIDMKIFEQSNGSFTITSAKGVVLVNGNESYDLNLNGSAVEWQSSGGSAVDITDDISNGKLGGFLDMRDEIVAKYKQDLTELASEFVWAVNEQHSEGVGLKLFQASSSVTGSYTTLTDLDDLAYGSATDSYVDYTGTFSLWIGDADGENLQQVTIDLDDVGDPIDENSTLAELATSINNQITAAGLTGVTASVSNGALVLTADATHTFGFSDDTSNILAALGVNTFFTGSTAGGMAVNNVIRTDKDFIAAAQIDSTTSDFATGDNTNALAITDLQYSSRDISEWTYDRINGNTEGTSTVTIEEYYHSLVGSLGIKASSISRSKAFNETMVHELSTMRESISSVSLDDEMTQLMLYQQAYAAAAKLIGVSDEMLNTLLDVK